MIHVKSRFFVRTELTVPGAGSIIHVAELEEIDARMCTMVRIIELDPAETIRGAARAESGVSVGMQNAPNEVVPHPDTYADFPDIDHRVLTESEFEGLWSEAIAKFPEL